MAFKLLAENDSVVSATPDDIGRLQLQFSSVCLRHARFGRSTSSPLSQLRLPYNGGRNARSWDRLSVKRRGKRTKENILSGRSRKEQLETRICHGLVSFHQWIYEGRCREGRGNVCGCFLWSASKGGRFSMAENGDKQRKRERQLVFFALCARAMVASHMVQSPLLSFLWSNWPSMVKDLSAGEQGNGNRNPIHWKQLGHREHDHESSLSNVTRFKVLLLGFVIGAMISVTLTSAVPFGVLLDLCFWLCLLCSLVYLAVCTVQAVFVAVMLVARGGVTSFCKSFNIALQGNVCGALHFPVSSLWRRPKSKAYATARRHMGTLQSRANNWNLRVHSFAEVRIELLGICTSVAEEPCNIMCTWADTQEKGAND
ncbi:hypothetical protein GOP47_0030122 [Adiantum capillus-veneris]|nr:hypothetical protein GOP47_0030122 [Adiantum capillus-veneris]